MVIVLETIFMMPAPAAKARAKMHGISFIWVVGPATDAGDARVGVGLQSHVER